MKVGVIIAGGPVDEQLAGDELRARADAGATWFVHSDWDASAKALRTRIEAGPPRLDS